MSKIQRGRNSGEEMKISFYDFLRCCIRMDAIQIQLPENCWAMLPQKLLHENRQELFADEEPAQKTKLTRSGPEISPENH